MATVRCEVHGAPKSKKHKWISVEPVGYPNDAVICSTRNCSKSGLVWLHEDDKMLYDAGQRMINTWGSTVTLKVK